MSLAIGALLKAAASSLIGNKLKKIAIEKVTTIAREKLGLPADAPDTDIEEAFAADPKAYASALESVNDWRIEQETTYQIALKEQGETDRVALKSDSAFVRNARPAMLYLGGLSCFALIVFGALIVWMRPESLPDFVDLTAAIAMPLGALLMAGGVYAYRRTTDKAISNGLQLPSLINLNGGK